MECLRAMDAQYLAWIDIRPEVMRAYNERLQERLRRTVWAATDHSWYKLAGGRITNNWSGSTAAYWWLTRRANLGAYRQVKRVAVAEPAVAQVA